MLHAKVRFALSNRAGLGRHFIPFELKPTSAGRPRNLSEVRHATAIRAAEPRIVGNREAAIDANGGRVPRGHANPRQCQSQDP